MKLNNYVDRVMTNLHFKFPGLSLGSRLCIQSSTSKSRQNRFVTKITGESVLHNPIDLQVFSKQVIYMEEENDLFSLCIKLETVLRIGMFTIVQNDFDLALCLAKLWACKLHSLKI